MDIRVYKVNPKAPDLSSEQIEQIEERLKEDLVKPSRIGCMDSEQYWREGHVDHSGYRFIIEDEKRVLVTHTNEDGNEWYEHAVPVDDKRVIRAYIDAMEGDDCAWILLKDEEIQVN